MSSQWHSVKTNLCSANFNVQYSLSHAENVKLSSEMKEQNRIKSRVKNTRRARTVKWAELNETRRAQRRSERHEQSGHEQEETEMRHAPRIQLAGGQPT